MSKKQQTSNDGHIDKIHLIHSKNLIKISREESDTKKRGERIGIELHDDIE